MAPKKKEKNLYEFDESGKYDRLIEESLYPTKDEFAKIADWLAEHTFSEINSLIVMRGNHVAGSIVDHLAKE